MFKRYILEYFWLNLKDYENIGLDLPIGMILMGLAVALCVSVFYINARKRSALNIITALLRHEAIDEEGAKSLKELSLDGTFGIRSALSKGGKLSKIVGRVGESVPSFDEYSKQKPSEQRELEKANFEGVKLYIKSEELDAAKRMFEEENASYLPPIILSLSFIAVFAIIGIVLPDLLSLINSNIS